MPQNYLDIITLRLHHHNHQNDSPDAELRINSLDEIVQISREATK